jgi:MinD superfamily P-loop ATPase
LETPVDFLDCDVEESNAHLFLKPAICRCNELQGGRG